MCYNLFMSSRVRRMGLLLFSLLLVVFPAYAQNYSGATLLPPDSSEFPRIKVFLDFHGPDGTFVHHLTADQVQILENGEPRPLLSFSEARPGAQVVFALNPGDSFTIRNIQGVSRYDLIYQGLAKWANERLGSSVDDLSLVVSNSQVRTHTSAADELIAALDAMQINPADSRATLDSLSRALDIVSDTLPRQGMERVVFLITSPLEGDQSLAQQDLLARALEQHVRIFVWYVASPDALDALSARQLRDLSQQTGGDFVLFEASQGFPSPENYLTNLRDIYLLEYETGSSASGRRELVVEIQHEDQRFTTPPLNFDIILEPPDPAFISPVAEIVRQAPEEQTGVFDQINPADLIPKEQPLQVLIDFPDGRSRLLRYTRLYVDGQLVAENIRQPFDRFVWDISNYTTTAQHLLRVEAVDSLGLTGTSIEIPITVRVNTPGANPLRYLLQNAPFILGLLVVLGAAVALLILILIGKIRPQALRVPARFRNVRRRDRVLHSQPTPSTGEVKLVNEVDGRRFSGWVSRLHWPQRRLAPQPYAFLVPISASEENRSSNPISIDTDEITLGKDRSQAVLVIDDPTLEGLHARLVRNADGDFILFDEGSIAGTWVNHSQVGGEGVRINHGDLIYLGRSGFLFRLRGPGSIRKPVVMRQRFEG